MKNEEIIEIHERREYWIKDVDRKFKKISNELKNNLTVLELALNDLNQSEKKECYYRALSDTRRIIDDHLALSPHPGTHRPAAFSPEEQFEIVRNELLFLARELEITWRVNACMDFSLAGDPEHFRYVILGIVHHMLMNDPKMSSLNIFVTSDNYYAKIDFIEEHQDLKIMSEEILDDLQVRLMHSIIQTNGGAFLFDQRQNQFVATCLWPLHNSPCTIPSHDLGGKPNENNP